jgi:hypothetical protein
MSSAISTDEPGLHPTAQSPRGGDPGVQPTAQSPRGDPGLQPWQFFMLAGMLSATGVVLIVSGQSPASLIVLSLTVIAASLVALGTYRAFAPLVVPEIDTAPPVVVGRVRAALEREKALALRSIKELDFDYAMKKVGKADYEDMSARLRSRAIGLMRQLDEGDGYRAEIERELRNRLSHAAGHTAAPEGQGFSPGENASPDPLDASPDPVHARPKGLAFRRCECGTSNDGDARFCKNCGRKLAVA